MYKFKLAIRSISVYLPIVLNRLSTRIFPKIENVSEYIATMYVNVSSKNIELINQCNALISAII